MESTLGSYVQVRGGHRIYLDNPDFSPMSIEDLALSLAHINRYAGNADRQINVAAHSYLIATYLLNCNYSTDAILAGLVHDAPEVVTNDVPAPVKRYCGSAFVDLELRLQNAALKRWQIYPTAEDWKAVKDADTRILADEQLFCRASVTDNDWLADIYPLSATELHIGGKVLYELSPDFIVQTIRMRPAAIAEAFVSLYNDLKH